MIGIFIIFAIIGLLIYVICRLIREQKEERVFMQDDIPADNEIVKVVFKKRTIYMTAAQLSEWSGLTTREKMYFLKNLKQQYITKIK